MRRNSMWSFPVAALIALPMLGNGAEQVKLPDGVTPAMVTQGEQIFSGNGNCATCHGVKGVGTPIGPNLADKTWLHVDGSFTSLVDIIVEGVMAPKEHAVPMMPKGGSDLTDAQVKAVAAYVWTLSAE